MSELEGQPGQMAPEEGLTVLQQLWGQPDNSREQRCADAWARRALAVEPQPGDSRLLDEVDATIAEKYGVHPLSRAS